jgi:hypothetical protein
VLGEPPFVVSDGLEDSLGPVAPEGLGESDGLGVSDGPVEPEGLGLRSRAPGIAHTIRSM